MLKPSAGRPNDVFVLYIQVLGLILSVQKGCTVFTAPSDIFDNFTTQEEMSLVTDSLTGVCHKNHLEPSCLGIWERCDQEGLITESS